MSAMSSSRKVALQGGEERVGETRESRWGGFWDGGAAAAAAAAGEVAAPRLVLGAGEQWGPECRGSRVVVRKSSQARFYLRRHCPGCGGDKIVSPPG